MPVVDYEIPLSFYTLKLDGFSPVFCVGDHVLIERFTGKTFVYKAVDLRSKEIIHLFHTKSRLDGRKHQAVAVKIAARCDLEPDRPKVRLKTGLELLAEKNRAIFTHVLTKSLEYINMNNYGLT